MIRRGYPKYINITDFTNTADSIEFDQNELFFNLGRSAIKFTLQVLSAYYGRHLTVIVQSFNCSTVVDAVLESGCTAVLTDVKMNDYSLDFNELITIKLPDVLILTHYQGVPNLQYLQIAEYCRENNIFLIEDLCQTEYSRINGHTAGEFADVSIHAFSFDKPFCCLTGGSLYLNQVSEGIKQRLLDKYSQLPMESITAAKLDLSSLNYLLRLYAGSSYRPELDNMELIRTLKRRRINENIVSRLASSRIIQKLYSAKTKLMNMIIKPTIPVTRLNPLKIDFILRQRQQFDWEKNQSLTDILEKWLILQGYSLPDFPDTVINWNRYSLYDPSDRLKRELNKLNIEAGNFNWPVAMHRLYSKNLQVVKRNSYINTELLCEHIVNIPVWCDLTEVLKECRRSVNQAMIQENYF